MAEEIINYQGHSKTNWWVNKKRGLTNRYHKYKRYLRWEIHTRIYRIEPDYSKLPVNTIPVLINNFNRLDLLQKQIDWLLKLDSNISIIIVDNNSTYPPLLDYYENLDHPLVQVVYLHFNSWRRGAAYLGKQKLKEFKKFVITDSDLLPYSHTPKDLISHLAHLLDRYPEYNHIGTSLEIDDLPDHYPLKETVIGYESRFWPPTADCLNEEVYKALIDTTFAMYRNTSTILATSPALRTARPYTLQHVDWYSNPRQISEEFEYYLRSCKSFATWAHEGKRQAAVGNKLGISSVSSIK